MVVDVDGSLPELRVTVAGGEPLRIQIKDARALSVDAGASGGGQSASEMRASMPGKVVKVLCKPGDVIKPGSVRHLQMTDGSVLDENFVEFERPSSFAYQMSGIRPPLSLLVSAAGGRWVYTGDDKHTRITWTYTCTARNLLIAPVTALLIKLFMNTAMSDCLQQLKAQCEKAR